MPREWIDVEELRKKHWKKQESKQMTKLEELRVACNTAYADYLDAKTAYEYAAMNALQAERMKLKETNK